MRGRLAFLLYAISALTGTLLAQDENLPAELRGWQDWVLDEREHLRCPYVGGADATARDGRLCMWPGPIEIDADATGASFAQQLEVYAPGFFALPGDAQAWPQDVAVDGRAAPIVARAGRPHLRLAVGTHRVTGRLAWSGLPEAMALPSSVSLVELRVEGVRIAQPERTGDNLRLGATRIETQVDRLDVQIYRKLTDSLPGRLTTRLVLNVAGRPRETLLGPLLPDGFVPMQLAGPLPARLQPDGLLRVQVRPGTWTLDLEARAPSALDTVRVPQSGVPEEVWSFEADDRLRSASIENVPGIDPAQANVPEEWRGLPAYRLAAGGAIAVTERSRGAGGADRNQLHLTRELWRDFDGHGYTFLDYVGGEMRQDWRLEMAAPWILQGARQEEESLLVTQGAKGRAGVELRTPGLDLEALGRLEQTGGAFPATGWTTRLAGLEVILQLPPGHRLLAAPGVDVAASAWLNRWRLLDIFAVLLVAAVALRVAGLPAALLSLLAFTLTHHELPALTWAVLNLLIAIALARAVPAGRVRKLAGLWRALSTAIVVLFLVPFALTQARAAFFPQLPALAAGLGAGQTTVSSARRGAAAPAAAPMAEMEAAQDAAGTVDEIVVTGMKRSDYGAAIRVPGEAARSVLDRYAPGTQLQNGPGIPQWNYESHVLQWGGPVEPAQTMRLVVVTPFWLGLWRIAGLVLATLALYAFLRNAYPGVGRPRLDRWLRITPAATAVVLLCVWPLATPRAHADTPAPELLQELQRRLSRPPQCAPDCVSVARAQVELSGGTLEIRLEAHAQTLAVLALPEAAQRWQPAQVLLDGAPAGSLARDAGGTLSLALPQGVHDVVLRGAVPATETLRLVFAEPPARIQVHAPGWQVAGVDEGRLLADSLSLIRPVRAAGVDGEAAGASGAGREEFPPFVRVIRTIALGLDWTITTRVERLAPEEGAFTLRLPLLPGESVLSAGLPVRDGHIELAMPAGVSEAGWTSSLARADTLELAATAGVPWVEVWRFAASPIWHLAFEGTPELLGDAPEGAHWVHVFAPRPSETLAVEVTRPPAIAGPTFAFERARHAMSPGRRSTDTTLELDYRSTQGGRHEISLPAGARLRSVLADGVPLGLHDQDGKLALPLTPGEHSLELTWQDDSDISLVTRPGAIVLGAPASNVGTSIAVPENRWLLFAAGGGVGPAILYWAELAVFVVLALLLGRLRRTPLATYEWLLVGLGLSTFSWSVLLLFAAWVFAFEWRARWAADVRPAVFNGVQLALALLTLVALGSLLSAIPNGLLGSPDMRVAGAGSHGGLLEWFHDRIDSALPRPVVISVSIWYYKAAMLAWALWLSFALVRWVRWAWHAGGAQGLWRRRGVAAPQIG